jgi:hypothetical protein
MIYCAYILFDMIRSYNRDIIFVLNIYNKLALMLALAFILATILI